MSTRENDIIAENIAETIQENEMIMLDAHETFDADKRDGNNGTMITVEQVNEAAYAVGEQTFIQYQHNRIAMEKLPF